MAKTGTYLFKNKDPVIDVLRTAIQLYASITNLTFAKACNRIAMDAGLTPHTLHGWFHGATLRPFYYTVCAVVLALGRDVQIGSRKLDDVRPMKLRKGKKPQLRLVKPSKMAA